MGRRVVDRDTLPQLGYGATQEKFARDLDFAKLYANTASFAELMGRNIAVGVDL